MKNKKILIMIAVVLLIIVIGVIGFTFAKYQSIGESNINPKVAKWHVLVNDIDISDGKTKKFTANIDWNQNDNIYNNGKTLIAPGSKGIVSFDIDARESQVSLDYVFTIDTEALDSHKQIKITKVTATQKNSEEETQLLGLKTYSGTISLNHINEISTIKIYIEWDPEINDDDDYNLGTKDIPLNIGIKVTVSQHITDTLAYAVLKNAILLGVKEAGRTEFNKENKSGDEKTLNITEDDYGVSYYYKGHVQDNFINFAGKCFRIVRIQGDGSVKIILDDNENECQNSTGIESTTYEGEIAGSIGQEKAFIGKTMYGYKMEDNAYRFDYENNAGGKANNVTGAKQMIDDWINNISESDKSKLKTEEWCLGNQNKWYSDNTWEETTEFEGENDGVRSESYKKILNNENIDLKCGEESDRVTDLGGLLTAEEVELAGPFKDVKGWKSYLWIDFLNEKNLWWLATPARRYYKGDSAFRLYGSSFHVFGDVYNIYNVRPVVVLSSMIKITGGDGTHENPYTV